MSDTPASNTETRHPGDSRGAALRKPLVIGNWKMNGDVDSNERLLAFVRGALDAELLTRVDVAVCPPFPYLGQVAARLAGSGVRWGAQNVARQDNGAFTGEVSARMLADLGCSWVIVGHSERRQLFGETDEVVAQKVRQALAHGVRPVVCLGETLEERRSDVTEKVLARQLEAVMPAFHEAGEDFVLAYEPVWAIGTGLMATPAQAQAVHAFLRQRLAEAGMVAAERVRILYGGSAKASNVVELFEQEDVDGGLIGGAALVEKDFVAICNIAADAASKQARPASGGPTDG